MRHRSIARSTSYMTVRSGTLKWDQARSCKCVCRNVQRVGVDEQRVRRPLAPPQRMPSSTHLCVDDGRHRGRRRWGRGRDKANVPRVGRSRASTSRVRAQMGQPSIRGGGVGGHAFRPKRRDGTASRSADQRCVLNVSPRQCSTGVGSGPEGINCLHRPPPRPFATPPPLADKAEAARYQFVGGLVATTTPPSDGIATVIQAMVDAAATGSVHVTVFVA